MRHYTQNVDCLEDLTGLERSKTVQAHGHLRTGSCLYCKKKFTIDYIKACIEKNDTVIPECDVCPDKPAIKPDVVLFGENLPSEFVRNTEYDFNKCDLLIVMGTSLVVKP